MAISIVNTQSAEGADTSATTVNVSPPTGMADGDVMVAVAQGGGAVPTVSGGAGSWVTVATVSQEGSNTAVYLRVVSSAAAETTAYTFTQSSAQRLTAEITAYRGVDNTTPQDATAVTSTQASSSGLSTFAATGITTVTADAWYLAACGMDGADAAGTTLTIPTGMTTVYHASSGGGGKMLAVAYLDEATAGATGSSTWTSNSALAFTGVAVALRPATSGTNYTQTPTNSAGLTDSTTRDLTTGSTQTATDSAGQTDSVELVADPSGYWQQQTTLEFGG